VGWFRALPPCDSDVSMKKHHLLFSSRSFFSFRPFEGKTTVPPFLRPPPIFFLHQWFPPRPTPVPARFFSHFLSKPNFPLFGLFLSRCQMAAGSFFFSFLPLFFSVFFNLSSALSFSYQFVPLFRVSNFFFFYAGFFCLAGKFPATVQPFFGVLERPRWWSVSPETNFRSIVVPQLASEVFRRFSFFSPAFAETSSNLLSTPCFFFFLVPKYVPPPQLFVFPWLPWSSYSAA